MAGFWSEGWHDGGGGASGGGGGGGKRGRIVTELGQGIEGTESAMER